jgi:predicted nucleic acid-binding protein
MRVLLDTNIIIHREASRVILRDIGTLFRWLDRLKYEKCIHPASIAEIRKHKDADVVATFEIKLENYHVLQTLAPDSPEILAIRAKYDQNDNDRIDTALLKEVFAGRVAFLITEDRKIHKKAASLGISQYVFTIDTFLEKAVAENPDLVDYKVLSVKKEHFGNVNLNDPFFDSFKRDYPEFDGWFNRKADEIAYLCKADDGSIMAFLYVKVEGKEENYFEIQPPFPPKQRLKIGTFKVASNGYKLGERFLKIIFDNALQYDVDEIYVTLFKTTEDQQRLISLLTDWGFAPHGIKHSEAGEEVVYTRDFTPQVIRGEPNLTYPYFSNTAPKFIVPIYPEYHTELFPDSILRTESPDNFVENRPNRNAISKVYISRSVERHLQPGNVIVFYRTAAKDSSAPAHYTSVATTIGVVQNLVTNISSLKEFIAFCRKRSVFSDSELAEYWNYTPSNRPFIVNFLYICSFAMGNRLNLSQLKALGIIDKAPRGFERLSETAFQTLMEHTHANKRLIVD